MTTYAHIGYIQRSLMLDAPTLSSALQMYTQEGIDKAAREGYTLSADSTIEAEDTVYIENWSGKGPAIVGFEVARLAGLDPDQLPAGPTIIKINWEVTEAP